MQIGILGAGRIGQALAGHFVRAGHEVILANSRGPESLKPLIETLGPNARAGHPSDAAAAPTMFLCVMWPQVPKALEGLGAFGGRIVVDATNPLEEVDGKLTPINLGERTSSEIVSGLGTQSKIASAIFTDAFIGERSD